MKSLSPVFLVLASLGLSTVACGPDSPVTPTPDAAADGAPSDAANDGPPPITKSDKVDLVLMIDNSVSMSEKQSLLSQSLTDLLAGPLGQTKDLHIGILSSSLGGGGSPDICDGTGSVPTGITRHDDDQGHLLNRTRPPTGPEGAVDAAKPVAGGGGNFLAWLPGATPAPNVQPYSDLTKLGVDFQTLVKGVGEFGCGLEAQLESWYRFLVQPDPWASLTKSATQPPYTVSLTGVDNVLLKQRKDFLRPDSLLVVLVVTDEPDSWSDPLALGGRGWITRTQNFPSSQAKQAGTLPRPTSECLKNPADPDCMSCGFGGTKPKAGTPVADDPECKKSCGANCVGFYTSAEDNLNVRYSSRMKARYGFDPQFPVSRYVDGLTSALVPSRDKEHDANGAYAPQKECTNPIFAASLPASDGEELCKLPKGSRDPNLVLYGVIGGVPRSLIPPNGGGALSKSDWVKVLGQSPETLDQTGIDPRMIESTSPRAGLPPPASADTADPDMGREWTTSLAQTGLDYQLACTFELSAPRDCTLPANDKACDCVGAGAGQPGGVPLCDPAKKTTQLRGKAYPTIRELMVARDLGDRSVIASICAGQTKDPTSLNFGYRAFFRDLGAKISARLR